MKIKITKMKTNLNNQQLFDLSIFSKDKITYLSDQISNKKLFRIGYYHFFKIPSLDLSLLKDFLQILDFNKAYIVLPIIATDEIEGGGPILSLSKQILITRDSNAITIRNFLLKQMEIACMNYGIANLGEYTVVLKFRPISLKEDVVKAVPKIQFEIQETHIKRNISLMNSKFYNGSILPLTMNLEMYGTPLNKMLSIYYILKFDLDPNGKLFHNNDHVIYIKINGTKHEGILFKDKTIYYKFEDVLLEGNNFVRTMEQYIIFIENFSISHFERIYKTSFITSSKTNAKLNTNIVTFDIETYVKDNKFIPFACGWYDGETIQTYYLTDFKSHYDMLLQALTDLLVFNPNAKVYIHNFSNFDYMFMIKVLFENFIVKPNFKDNKVINLTFQKEKNKAIIEMFDSYLILPSSLRTLAQKYQVTDLKGFFPYSFVSESTLDFIGAQLGIAIDDFGLSMPKLHYSHYLIFKYKKIVLGFPRLPQ